MKTETVTLALGKVRCWDNIRGVTIHRYIDISYRECQRYAYRIVGACIDTHDISSSGRNQAIKCPQSHKIFQIHPTKCWITVMGWNLIFPMISHCVKDILYHISIDRRKWGLFAIMSEMLFKRFKSVHIQAFVLQSCKSKLLTLNLFKRCETKQLRTNFIDNLRVMLQKNKTKWQMLWRKWVNLKTLWGSSNSSSSSNT